MRQATPKFLATVCIAFALGSATLDGRAQADPTQPPDQVYDWTGIYVGAHGGYGFEGNSTWTLTNDSTAIDAAFGNSQDIGLDGLIGGGQIGYNFQHGSFVFGPEVSVSLSDIDGRTNSNFAPFDDITSTDLEVLVTAGARIGYVMDNLLVFAKGGYAGGDVNFRLEDTVLGGVIFSDNNWHDGFVVGGGVEYMWGSLLFGFEYQYIDLGSENHEGIDSNANLTAFDVDLDGIHAVMGRVSLQLGRIFGSM